MILKHKIVKILLIIVGFSSLTLHSQQITVQGKLFGALKKPLAYTHVLAIPDSDGQEISFAITKENGEYKLKLAQNQVYKITVSHLGYIPQTISITTTNQDIIKNFILLQNLSQLKAVTLNYTPPIIVKKDTITYGVDAFATGEERKLRDVLKKLPGVEVDRAGNVTVQGKRVTKVLVENKTFFTGDSKLAVNNIPSDAVDKIEILDNYSEIAMLKGLADSDAMAMNIILKEDKKKFVFGDVEAGAGAQGRYLAHSNLFYYSPKTTVNFIGDNNNIGAKSFSFSDYMEFEGGFGKLIKGAGGNFSKFNTDFTQFLSSQDFTSNTNLFGALNIRRSINNTADLSGYVITSKSKTQALSSTLNEYLTEDPFFIENRTVSNKLNNFFTIAKFTLDYDPSYREDFAYNSFVKVTNNDANGLITTLNPALNNNINTISDAVGLNLKQNISYSRKLSKTHTGTLEATYSFQNDKPIVNWLTDQQILQGLIPLVQDDIYNILQTKKVKSHQINAIVKDYWVLNNFNHLYTSGGVDAVFSDFYSQDLQQLSDGVINNFNTLGFGNDFNYNFFNAFVGLEYKFQIGIASFKPGLFYHFYNWKTTQFQERVSNYKALLLPQFTSKIDFSSSEKINFKYQLNAQFPAINRLANNFILSSFNSVFRGNTSLENQLYHTGYLIYSKRNLFKKLNFNASIHFNKKVKHFKNVTQLQGIEKFSTQILFDRPEHNWSMGGAVSKKINKIRYKLRSRFSYSDFFQIVNDQTNKNISKSLSNTLSAESFFKNLPNLTVGYTNSFSNYLSGGVVNKFRNDRFFALLEYDFLKDFILKADYTFDNYNNKNNSISNTFNSATTSLFYQKEDSPWGFEVAATNIFDTTFKQQNSFNSFLISDTKTFILPRIIMFKIAYKL